MTAFGEPVVVDEFGVRALCPTTRRLVDLIGERAHGNWDLDASDVEETSSGRDLCSVPIEARRRDRSVRQPVKRDVVENVVTRKPLRLSIESA